MFLTTSASLVTDSDGEEVMRINHTLTERSTRRIRANSAEILMQKLEKDISIINFLDKLSKAIPGKYDIWDRWEADLMAIGIINETYQNRLVYVCTFNQEKYHYFYECEHALSNSPSNPEYKTISQGDKVSFDTLLAVIKNHLEV